MSDFITVAELRIEAERLCDENERLEAENDKLRNDADLLRAMWSQERTEKRCHMAENAKLRELARHMYTCMEHYESDGSISCDRCPLDNDTGDCDYERRMHELGVEVDG